MTDQKVKDYLEKTGLIQSPFISQERFIKHAQAFAKDYQTEQLKLHIVSKRNSKMREKIATFLINNGFNEDTEKGAENRSFFKEGLSSIDIGDEITFIGDGGDWLNIPLDYYAIIGALLHYRMIPVDYVY